MLGANIFKALVTVLSAEKIKDLPCTFVEASGQRMSSSLQHNTAFPLGLKKRISRIRLNDVQRYIWWLPFVKQMTLGSTRKKKFSASLLFHTLHEAQIPQKQRAQVSHSYEQADKWLLQVTEYLNITGMFTFKVKWKLAFTRTVIERLLLRYSDTVAGNFWERKRHCPVAS